MDIGIALDPTLPPHQLAELTHAAEESGIPLAVIAAPSGGNDGVASLDPWTLAIWLAGRTSSITIAVPPPGGLGDGSDPDAPVPAVLEHASTGAHQLTNGRVLAADPTWVDLPAGSTPDQISAIVGDGVAVLPVVDADAVRSLQPLVGTRVGSWRSPAARARRRAGIDYDGLPRSLAASAVEPGDAGHRALSSTYLRGGDPGLVLRPHDPDQVADALRFAARHRDLPLGIRSGGHGISGRSTNRGGLVIDVGGMNEVTVLDRAARTFRAGPGATWKQVAAAIAPQGWAITSGDYGGVGVGGLATAGGIGLLGRRQGLTIDRLRAVEIVLPDGELVRASEHENRDLFWGVRGAGANLGVVTAFELQAGAVGLIGSAQLAFVVDDIAQALVTFGRVASEAPRDTTAFLVTGPPRGGGYVVQVYAVVDSPDADVIIDRLEPFTEIGALAQQQVVLTEYSAMLGMVPDVGPDGHHGFGEPTARSSFLTKITPEVARAGADLIDSGAAQFFQLRTMGGAIADVDPGATAFAHRDAAFSLAVMARSDEAVRSGWQRLQDLSDGLYLSFDTRTGAEVVDQAFPPATLARLRDLKRRYDPTSLLRDNFPVAPSSVTEPTLEPR
jgi:hypothetical protein